MRIFMQVDRVIESDLLCIFVIFFVSDQNEFLSDEKRLKRPAKSRG
jgi:hypothetical protein